MQIDNSCSICGEKLEIINYLFAECKRINEVQKKATEVNCIISGSKGEIIEWIERLKNSEVYMMKKNKEW